MIEGVHLICGPYSRDARGVFSKVLSPSITNCPARSWAECFWSASRRGMVRGFHFQAPPADHDKLIFCPSGSVFDVALDIRRRSSTYGKITTAILDADGGKAIFLPRGIAHAFQALTENAVVVYLTTTQYNPALDSGVLWESIAVKWPEPVTGVSSRDSSLPSIEVFSSPF